jgi:hypothetical protein
MPGTFALKNLFRPLAHAVYGFCLFLMLLLPYCRYDWAREEMEDPSLPGCAFEDTGEGALFIGLLLCVCVLTQGVLAVSAQSRRERIVCAALLLSAVVLWSAKAYG